MLKIIIVAGARPNFIKASALIEEFKKHKEIEYALVHTGQHYHQRMSDIFFKDMDIPKPDFNLGVGSGARKWQINRIKARLEPIIKGISPDIVVVLGDVNSTLAGAEVAKKLNIKLAHVEAGLRCGDMNMAEEINRIETDKISDFLFTPTGNAGFNLIKEGISKEKIFFTGNVMIDSLARFRPIFLERESFGKYALKKEKYALATIHRPENADNRSKLRRILGILAEVSEYLPVIFPVHPRTLKNLKSIGQKINSKRIIVEQPLGYLDFMNILANAKLVLTDSGGIQGESSILNVPCLTLRSSTEWAVTVKKGTNVIVGRNLKKIAETVQRILGGRFKKNKNIPLWDGKTSMRIVKILKAAKTNYS